MVDGGADGVGGSGGSGIVILRYPASRDNLTSVSAGLTYTLTNTGGYKIYSFTAGTGTIKV
jgi:ribonuclease HI